VTRRVDLSEKAWRVWALKSKARQDLSESRERELRVLMAGYDPTPFNPPRLVITWRKPSENEP
jgi:hypothetical protein